MFKDSPLGVSNSFLCLLQHDSIKRKIEYLLPLGQQHISSETLGHINYFSCLIGLQQPSLGITRKANRNVRGTPVRKHHKLVDDPFYFILITL